VLTLCRNVDECKPLPDGITRDAADWLMQGFDATVVATGQSGTGKTHLMFGGGGGAHEHDRPGISSNIFRAIFTRAGQAGAGTRPLLSST
jgi:hypothetical protein